MTYESPPCLMHSAAATWTRVRRPMTTLFALLAFAVSACDVAEHTTGPAPDVAARAAVGTKQSLTQAFVDAQGTYCDVATPGDCEFYDLWDIGYISAWCGTPCDLVMGADFAGVNTKWWAKYGLSPSFPTYYYTGAVSESRLADGRRRIIANIRGHNTFVLVLARNDLAGVLIGADFFEYPRVSPLALTPILGDVSLAAELIVPADFVGMPDVSHMLFFPVDGMEIRRFNITINVRGPLRQDYDGFAAGTVMDAHGIFRYMPKLATVGVKSRRLIEQGYDPTSRVTLKPARGQ